jgi:hypothetical protein
VNEYRGNINIFQENVQISVTTISKQSHSELLYYFFKGRIKGQEGHVQSRFYPLFRELYNGISVQWQFLPINL